MSEALAKTHAIGVEAVGIGKRFGPFKALSEVSLKVRPATVHGLLGENGAGKSTLVKCLLGYYRADEGAFIVDGREATIERPADADALGLGMVYQHFTLVPSMTVAENLVMARSDVPAVIDWRAERIALDAFMARMPFQVKLDAPVGSLAAGERQKTEILKQLYLQRRFLVLDEPTSVLTPQEAVEMLGLVRDLAHSGALTIVIITHKLKEVGLFVDDVTVLRRGRMGGVGSAKELGPAQLTAMMIGEPHAPKNAERGAAPEDAVRLSVRGLRTEGEDGRHGLDIAALDVHPREIVGIAGVSGNGQKELVEVLGGQRPMEAGEMQVAGAYYDAARGQAQERGVRVLPEEPLRNGCVPNMTITDNLNLRSFDVKDGNAHRDWLDRGGNVKLLIVANPCFGLDVKAVAETRARIMAARNSGTAVLLISEDLDEILELADRIVVMRDGKIAAEIPAAGADPQEIGKHMLGHA
jgi:ABC-type uncharacterized transport system ATPase subunit